jgi:transcriptional regulator with XRE-family HTH domain
MEASRENQLAVFLKSRRMRLDPAAFGFDSARRRTPGLRREEVAQRAHVSATWYTWLEQGRGGAPSADVLDRISRAMELTPAEREHLFLLARNRLPEVVYQEVACVTSQLQRVIDSLVSSPAIVKTCDWDIIAWNRAATLVLTDYRMLPPGERNILRLLFCNPSVRSRMPHWEADARRAVATFRLESVRAGASGKARVLAEELSQSSAEFAAMWSDNDVHKYGEGTKSIDHPQVGMISLGYSSFAVDDQPDLGLVIYTPSTQVDLKRILSLTATGFATKQVGYIPV